MLLHREGNRPAVFEERGSTLLGMRAGPSCRSCHERNSSTTRSKPCEPTQLRDPVVEVAEALPERPLEVDGQFPHVQPTLRISAPSRLVPSFERYSSGVVWWVLLKWDAMAALIRSPRLGSRTTRPPVPRTGPESCCAGRSGVPRGPLVRSGRTRLSLGIGFPGPEQAEADGEELQLSHRGLILGSKRFVAEHRPDRGIAVREEDPSALR